MNGYSGKLGRYAAEALKFQREAEEAVERFKSGKCMGKYKVTPQDNGNDKVTANVWGGFIDSVSGKLLSLFFI